MVMNSKYNKFAINRLKGEFGEMGSWRLILPYLEKKKCLDVGCADGLYLKYLQNDSLGIEQIEELAKKARASGMNVVSGDLYQELNKLKNNSFEGVLFSHVMEHVDCPICVLREINRILKLKGTLVLGLPTERNIYRETMNMDYYAGTHIYAFTIKNAKKLLEETGFVVEKIIYHLPKCRSNFGYKVLNFWNSIPFPFREYASMAYWVVARKDKG